MVFILVLEGSASTLVGTIKAVISQQSNAKSEMLTFTDRIKEIIAGLVFWVFFFLFKLLVSLFLFFLNC